MSETLDELLVKIDANVTGLLKGMSEATKASEHASKEMESHFKHMSEGFHEVGKLALEFAAIIGIKVGIEAFKEFVVGSFEAVSAMSEMSVVLGVNIEKLYGLKVAAAENGVSFETVTSAISKMSKKISEASTGSFEMNRSFRDLGLSSKELAELSPDEAFGKIADATKLVGNHMEKTRILMDLFGRSGALLGGMLKEGSKGIEEASDKAKKLGITVSEIDAHNIREVKDKFELLWATLNAIGTQLASVLSPYLIKIADQFLHAAEETGGFKDKIQSMVESAIKGIGQLVNTWRGLEIIFKTCAIGIAQLAQITNNALWAMSTSIVAVGQVFKNFWEAIKQTLRTGEAGFVMMAEGIKHAFFVALDDVGNRIANIMHILADQLQRTMPDVANSIRDTAFQVGRETNKLAVDSGKSLKELSALAGNEGDKMREAWSNLFTVDTENNSVVKFFKDGEQKSQAFVGILKGELQELVEAPLPSDAINKWADDAVKAVSKVKEAEDESVDDGDGGGAVQAKKDRLQKQFQIFNEYLDKETLAENDNYQLRQEQAQELFENKVITQQQRDQILQGLKEDHEQALTDIEAKQIINRRGLFNSETINRISTAGSMFGKLATLTESGNKRLVQIGKAARIAETIMNTAASAMACFNQGSQQGGPYLGAAYAAIAIAAGAVQLATINGVGGGGGGGSIGGAVSAGQAQPAQKQAITQSGDSGQVINMVVSDESMGKNFIHAMAKGLDRAIREDGVVIAGMTVNGGNG